MTKFLAAFTTMAAAVLPMGTAMAEQPSTIIIIDGSGSMWGQIDGRPKLEIARQTVSEVLPRIPAAQSLGLMAYGHRTRGDCSDIELVVSPSSGTAGAIGDAVAAMRFQGKTPLTEAVRRAAEALRSTEEPATVVLVTDGIETCDADPCAVANELEKSGVAFTAHVIGFGLTRAEGAQVACIAENTGGRYIQAGDADSLAEALTATVTDSEPPAPKPEAPEQESRTYYPGAEKMPGIALAPTGQTTGASETAKAEFEFPATGTSLQCAAICNDDVQCAAWRYEPKGSYFVDHARCFTFGASSEMDYNVYDVSEGWFSGIKDGVLMLVRPYWPQDLLPEAAFDAPATVVAGQIAQIGWTGPAAELDTIEIGLPGDRERWAYVYVADGNPAKLAIPGEPGEYELRYKFRDQFVIATQPITVTDADVSMSAPARVLAGSEVAVGWVGPDTDYDNIQLAVPGSDSYITYAYVRDNNPVVLTMPEEPGIYELRYKLADREVISTRPIEVHLADAAPHENRSGFAPVAATLQADTGGVGLAIMWSAVPLPGQNLPLEAWAMQESVVGPITERFIPGAYDVLGEAGDHVFAGRVDIRGTGPNVFTIPRSSTLSPAGEDAPDQRTHICAGPQPCAVLDAVGLSFTLPANWSTDEPLIYQTAGGVKAKLPTVTFYSPGDASVLLLNPVRWIEGNGVCTESAAGPLCMPGQPDPVVLAGLATILPSLHFDTSSASDGGRFGGKSFTAPVGGDPIDVLVPGWRKP